jgi:hypothetical protein
MILFILFILLSFIVYKVLYSLLGGDKEPSTNQTVVYRILFAWWFNR